MIVSIELPEGVEPERVRVQIHMADGPAFDAIVEGQEIREFEECGGFRSATVTLACGHEAVVFGSRDSERPQDVVVVAHG